MTSVEAAGSAPRFAVGDLVAGKYRVDRILGEGGMGVVVAARHEELGQKVAIKVLRPEIAGFEGALERFLREARAAARLESDHVARVFDVGKLGEDCAFMVMEHLEGQDLEKLLDERRRLDVEEAVDYVLEALEAVAHAHAAGIVHRDLKPSNLFLAEKAGGSKRIKVLDFGISKAETGLGTGSQQSSTLTNPQALLGSPAYMAPEQIRSSKSVDQRADIWSVGVILYELLTGVSPFAGESVGETFGKVIDAAPEPLEKLRPDLPAGLRAVISKCLESNRDKRFSTVGELGEALAPYASSRAQELAGRIQRVLGVAPQGSEMRRSIVPVDPSSTVNGSAATMAATTGAENVGKTVSAWSDAAPPAKRPHRAWMAIGALALLGGVGTIAFVMGGRGTEAKAPQSASAPENRSPAAAESPQPKRPDVAPIVETNAALPSAAPAPSIPASAAASSQPEKTAIAPLSTPRPTATAKKPPPTGTTTKKYPQDLLQGRD